MTTPVKLHVEDTGGTGRPVVLIHGWPLSGEAWEKQVPVLADAGFRVITYDRRGFGRSDKPADGYDYDSLTADLHDILTEKDLRDVTLVGFSMGGGEAARYIPNHGADRIASIVFAAAIPPYMMQGDDNPEGPLTPDAAQGMQTGFRADRDAFFKDFILAFFSAHGELRVTEADRQKAIELCQQSDDTAALACMQSFGTTDFRQDLPQITVPVLVLHGDADAIVPLEGSGQRTHDAIPGSELAVIENAPHGLNTSNPDEFNAALLDFLRKQ
ncbi:alpha/beta fold hydrolase [Paracoccus laeviglucosivorans]|uniref:Pimeloyl-ACP methyl ester carboxylesterase n=1 Tax=Paracoccus laeviglucosivorans TaxID=1197861 RepID=A0A521B534_9RHOB|nr:alpha/beta hydrolase [Paracoccus laeviglucosivorans]SMO42166.1 Pimeloyl-ACP methyl ester carboxylesterase [Paracoccus laeviglucosivorans]